MQNIQIFQCTQRFVAEHIDDTNDTESSPVLPSPAPKAISKSMKILPRHFTYLPPQYLHF